MARKKAPSTRRKVVPTASSSTTIQRRPGRPSLLENRTWDLYAKAWEPHLTVDQMTDRYHRAKQAAEWFESLRRK